MKEVQLDLLVEQAHTVQELPEPTMSYSDCTLNYRQYQQEVRHGLCSFDDDDTPKFSTVTECSLPTSANIVETFEQYGFKRERNFTIYGEAHHKSAGDVINAWLEKNDYRFNCLGKETSAGKWILAHAAEMNTASRLWSARRKHDDVIDVKRKIAQLEECLRVEQLTLSLKVLEAAFDRNFTVEEKKVKLKELGAQDKDL